MLPRHREARRKVRLPIRRPATVSFGEESLPVSCVIWNISDGGACLAVALPSADLPRHFTLNLAADGSVQKSCEVVWIDKRFVGVKFTEQAP
jgi:hypothetical protein